MQSSPTPRSRTSCSHRAARESAVRPTHSARRSTSSWSSGPSSRRKPTSRRSSDVASCSRRIHMNPSTAGTSSDVQGLVGELVQRARAAQRIAEGYDQARIDELVAAAGWAIIEPARNRALAELAVDVTGIGNVPDKILKNHRKTLGLLRDLNGAKSVGVIAEHAATGIVEIARPVGVVCAITPSTNPGATPANKIINALKGRNAVIVAPSPKGWAIGAKLIEYIHAQFDRIGAPRDLVQCLPAPIDKASTNELMRQ